LISRGRKRERENRSAAIIPPSRTGFAAVSAELDSATGELGWAVELSSERGLQSFTPTYIETFITLGIHSIFIYEHVHTVQ
jgi:hypothetical protein